MDLTGIYKVKVKAKDTLGAKSGKSETLAVRILESKTEDPSGSVEPDDIAPEPPPKPLPPQPTDVEQEREQDNMWYVPLS